MFSTRKLALAVALAAVTTVALANGAAAQYGYYSYPGSSYGYAAPPVVMAAPYYSAYASYAPGYYGSYGGYYGSYGGYYGPDYGRGRYSGPYRTDSAPLTGGGY